MAVSIEKTGKTVQQAINDALDELSLSVDDVIIEVIDEGESGGLLGRMRDKCGGKQHQDGVKSAAQYRIQASSHHFLLTLKHVQLKILFHSQHVMYELQHHPKRVPA